jgi:hypothetical protein
MSRDLDSIIDEALSVKEKKIDITYKVLMEMISEESSKIISVSSEDEADDLSDMSQAIEIGQDIEAEIDDMAADNDAAIRAAKAADPKATMSESNIYEAAPERGGIEQQNLIVNTINSQAKKAKVPAEASSNIKGSTTPDVVVSLDGDIIAKIESKSSKKGNEVSFFDQTIDTELRAEKYFGQLLRKIAIAKKLSFLKSSGGKYTRLSPDEVKAIPDDMLAYSIIKYATIDGDSPDCGKYGDITAPQPSSHKYYSMNELGYTNLKSSHRVVSLPDPESPSEEVLFFEKDENLGDKFVYFYKKDGDKEVYKKSSVKGTIKIKDRDYHWIASVAKRPASDSGALATKCFRVKSFAGMGVSETEEIKTAAANVIRAHLLDGGDDYFMVVKGTTPDQIYVFRSGDKDPLGYNAPIISSKHLSSVGFGTYGLGGVGKIRMALKCDVDFSGVPTLGSLNINL